MIGVEGREVDVDDERDGDGWRLSVGGANGGSVVCALGESEKGSKGENPLVLGSKKRGCA